MEYKVNEKIVIKTWEEMEEEFGPRSSTCIDVPLSFTSYMEKEIEQQHRILTIKSTFDISGNVCYYVKENEWSYSEGMIAGRYNEADIYRKTAKQSNSQKTFRDLLGKNIEVGDHVLHLWTTIAANGYSEGGVKSKIAKVIKHTKKGIGIEWRDKKNKQQIKKSTIFNTRNRIIVLDDKKLTLSTADIVRDVESSHETYKKGMKTRCKNLRDQIKFERENFDTIATENKELKKIIRELTKDSDRFSLMDI